MKIGALRILPHESSSNDLGLFCLSIWLDALVLTLLDLTLSDLALPLPDLLPRLYVT